MNFLENVTSVLNQKLRVEKMYTLNELAQKLNVSRPAVSKWLQGGTIEMKTIPALCEALEITPNELFGFDDKDIKKNKTRKLSKADLELLDKLYANPELKKVVEKY